MVRLIGSNSPLGSSNVPELTDLVADKQKQVVNNMLDNYQNASQAVQAEAAVATSDYQAAMMQINNEMTRKQMEREQNTRGFLSGFGELGTKILAGIQLHNEIQLQKKELDNRIAIQSRQMDLEERKLDRAEVESDRDYELNQQELGLQERKVDASIRQDELQQQRQAYEQAEKDTTQGIKNMLNDAIVRNKPSSYTEMLIGIDSAIAEFQESDEFKSMTPETQQMTMKVMMQERTNIIESSRSQFISETDKAERDGVDTAVDVGILGSPEARAALKTIKISSDPADVDAATAAIMNNAHDKLMNDPEYAFIREDKNLTRIYYTKIFASINANLDANLERTITNSDAAKRYRDGAEFLTNLEVLRSTGEMSAAEANAQWESYALENGINVNYSEHPNTTTNLQKQAIDEYNTNVRLEEMQEQAAGDAPVTEQIQEAVRTNVGTTIFNTVNSNQGVAAKIAELERTQRNRPQAFANPQSGNAITLTMLKRYESDRNQLLKFDEDIKRIDVSLAEIQTKITSAGDATPAELEALQNQLEQTTRLREQKVMQRNELTNLWQEYGINLNNPGDASILNGMRNRSAATLDAAKNTNTQVSNPITASDVNKGTGSGTQSNSTAATDSTKPVQKQVNNAVLYEYQAGKNKFANDVYEDEVAPEVMDASSEPTISSFMASTGKSIVDAVLAGDETKVQELIYGARTALQETLENGGYGQLTPEGYTAVQNGLMKIRDWTKNKKNYYNNKYGLQSRASSPPSFSSGSSTKPPQVTTPKNEAPAAPALALENPLVVIDAGNGVAIPSPYIGGNPTITSPFGAPRSHGKHMGLDFAGVGDLRVAAVQGGTVVFADDWGGFGNVTIIRTPDGLYEVYAHLDKMFFKKGDVVPPGKEIGMEGTTGTVTGRHLHFEVWNPDKPITGHPRDVVRNELNPIEYLSQVTHKQKVGSGTGAPALSSTNPADVSYQQEATFTGLIEISPGVYLSGSTIIDKNTGRGRPATQADLDLAPTGRKIYTNTTGDVQSQTGSGGRRVVQFSLPDEAHDYDTYAHITPSGQMDAEGNEIFYLSVYAKRPSGQLDRVMAKTVTIPGMEVLDGTFTIGTSGVAGEYSVTDSKGTGRNTRLGTSGIIFTRPEDHKAFQELYKRRGKNGIRMSITTYQGGGDTVAIDTDSPRGDYDNNRPLNLTAPVSGLTSTYRNLQYSELANYGYPLMDKDQDLAKSVHDTSVNLGIPPVWLADAIYSKTKMNPNYQNEHGMRGLAAISAEELERQGVSSDFKYYSPAEQIDVLQRYLSEVIVPGINGFRTVEEFLIAFAGGGVDEILKFRSNPLKYKSEQLDFYKSNLGKYMGRSYDFTSNSTDANEIHDRPISSCIYCNQMAMTNSFSSHIVGYNAYNV